MLNLGVIAPGAYFLDGAYGISEAAGPMPLQAQFRVELMSNALEIVGTWQQHSGRPTHGFKLLFSRDHTSQSQTDVVITGSFIRALKGRASFRRPAHELLAFDESREQALSLHFTEADDRSVFDVSGMLTLGENYYSFDGRVIPTEGRATLSNVIPILGGKVA